MAWVNCLYHLISESIQLFFISRNILFICRISSRWTLNSRIMFTSYSYKCLSLNIICTLLCRSIFEVLHLLSQSKFNCFIFFWANFLLGPKLKLSSPICVTFDGFLLDMISFSNITWLMKLINKSKIILQRLWSN